MRMKPVVLAFGAVVLLFWFLMNRYDQADSNLDHFYAQVRSADFTGARETIDEAIRLWPNNSRYYGWRAYCISQKLPSQCPGKDMAKRLSSADEALAQEAVRDYRRALELN